MSGKLSKKISHKGMWVSGLSAILLSSLLFLRADDGDPVFDLPFAQSECVFFRQAA